MEEDVDELIEEDIPTDRDREMLGGNLGENIISSLGHQAGITVS